MARPEAAIPKHDRTAAVFTLRNDAFEVAIIERMIFGLDGKSFVFGIERRPLGYGPRLEDAFDLETQIEVQAPRRVHLHNEAWIGGRRDRALAAGLARARKIALFFI